MTNHFQGLPTREVTDGMATASGGMRPTAAELTALEQAFARDPNSEAFRSLAEAYLALGRFMEAMVVCKKGIKARPGEASARLLLARIYSEQNKDRKALEELLAAVAAEPGQVDALRTLAALQLKLGEQPAGSETLLRAHARAPDDAAVAELMGRYGVRPPAPPPPPPAPTPPVVAPAPPRAVAPRVATAQGSAAQVARPRVPASPTSRPAPVRRSAPVDLSRYEEDEPPARKTGAGGKATLAIAAVGVLSMSGWLFYSNYRNRRDHEVTKLLKQTKNQLAKDDYEGYQAAESRAQRVLDLDPSNFAAEAYLAYIDALRYGENGEGGDYLKQAQEALARAKARGQPHAYIYAADAYIHDFMGDAAGAEAGLSLVLQQTAGGQRSYNSDLLSGVLGMIQMREGKLALARKNLVEAHNLAPADVRITAALGTLDSRLDSPETATAFFQQALRIDPDHVPSLLGLALISLQGKPPDLAGAEKLMGHLAQLGAGAMSPRQATFARFVRAQLLYAQGKVVQAQSDEKVAMDLDPKSAEMALIVGQRLRRLGQLDPAIAFLERALQLDPGRPVALIELGKAYLAQPGGATKALAVLKDAAARAPRDPGIAVQLGDAYQGVGEVEQARVEWQRALTLAPDDVEAHLELARYWSAKGDGAKAQADYTAVARRAEGDALAEAACALGKLALERGDASAAAEFLARARAANPRYAPAYFYSGELLLRDRSQRKGGKKFIAQYLQLAPAGPLAEDARRLLR